MKIKMQEQLEGRLQELKAEFKKGQTRLQDLEKQVIALRNNLLRISGAIQVLEEELIRIGNLSGDRIEKLDSSSINVPNHNNKPAVNRPGQTQGFTQEKDQQPNT